MANKNKQWFYSYAPSSGLTRAAYITEPKITEDHIKYYGVNFAKTEEEAKDGFSKLLYSHVEAILRNTTYLCDNSNLKKRLKKYGNSKGVHILEELETFIKKLEKL